MSKTYYVSTPGLGQNHCNKIIRYMETLALRTGASVFIHKRTKEDSCYVIKFIVSGDDMALKDFAKIFWDLDFYEKMVG